MARSFCLQARVRRLRAGPAGLGQRHRVLDFGWVWELRRTGFQAEPRVLQPSLPGGKGREGKSSPSRRGFLGVPRCAGSRRSESDLGPRIPSRVGLGGRALPWRRASAGGGLVQGLDRSLLLLRFKIQGPEGTSRAPSPNPRGWRPARTAESLRPEFWRCLSLAPRGTAGAAPVRRGLGRLAHRLGEAGARWAGSAPASAGRAWPAVAGSAQARRAAVLRIAAWAPR